MHVWKTHYTYWRYLKVCEQTIFKSTTQLFSMNWFTCLRTDQIFFYFFLDENTFCFPSTNDSWVLSQRCCWKWRRKIGCEVPPPLPKLKPNQQLWRLRRKRCKVSTATKKSSKATHPVTLLCWRQPKYPQKSATRRNKRDRYDQVLPDHRVGHIDTATHVCSLWMSRSMSPRSNSL